MKKSEIRKTIYHMMRLGYLFLFKYPVFQKTLYKIKPVISDLFHFGLVFGEASVEEKINLSSHPRGINLIGYYRSEKGTGEACRIADRVLQLTTWPSVIIPINDLNSLNGEGQKIPDAQQNLYNINLAKLNANAMKHLDPRLKRVCLKNRYTIGYWDWELKSFPAAWRNAFNHLQEVWVSSQFTYQAVAEVSPVPVYIIPHAISIKNSRPRFDRQHFNLPEKTFIFLFIFDFESNSARKNPLGLMTAFKQGFSTADKVCLVIKSCHGEQYASELKLLVKLSAHTNIIILDSIMSREEIDSLIETCDCYVSLHRAEGFGLTLAEAMSFGKPVIATGYSGNMDFMSENNSYLINYDLVHLPQSQGPYKKGEIWAEPDLDHAAITLRYVFEHQSEAKNVGNRAREHITQHFSPQAVAKMYESRFEQIEKIYACS